ncbi:MAG: TonB-dependent receptor [Pseudomonadales bacterium]|jgi:outer membrane receptor protein involved in Fe transport|nr:TonB-dependent receptor [Pseudomonadales bacterium]
MIHNSRRFSANTLTLAISTALVTLALTAQAADSPLEEIQVTGSRIKLTDGMVQPTPVTAVTTSEMRDFNPAASVSTQLDALPQFLNTQTAQRGGGTLFGDAAGSYLNLRNMGKQRTLVLFDGSRVVPADRASTVNVDNFPTALVRTVDVVTGGASAAYGADALAGVVNFVLDREFVGLKTSVSTGLTEHGDGFNYNFSAAGGTRIGERLHLVGSLEHRDQDQIYRDGKDISSWQSWGFVINPAWAEWRAANPTAAATQAPMPQRLTMPNVVHATQNPAGIITSTNANFRLNGYTFTDDGSAMRPFIKGDYYYNGAGRNQMMAGGPEADIEMRAFDSGPSSNEVVQHSGFGGFKYDLTDNSSIFGQIMLGRTEANTYGRRGNPEMGQQYFGTIYRENAFLPTELAAEMDRLGLKSVRIDKIGQVRTNSNLNFNDNRSDSNISQMYSASFGFDHVFQNDWSLHGSYQYGKSQLTSEGRNVLRDDHWYLSMDAVRDPKNGAIICNIQLRNPTLAELQEAAKGQLAPTARTTEYPSGLMPVDSVLVTPEQSIRDCAPMNVFGLGNVSQAAAGYMVSNKKGIRDLDQHFAELLLTGKLSDGWGAGPLSFAAGLTYRKEWFNQITIPIEFEHAPIQAPEVGVRGAADALFGAERSIHHFSATSWATGDFNVWEWFSELNVPVWASRSGEQRLDGNLAFRQSDYSRSGKIDSWKMGLELQVYKDLRMRMTQSRDVREPTFGELFEVGGGGANVTDPSTRESYTITLLSGGNANLNPEKADTLTAGFVWQPTFANWVDGFQVSADYYNIDVADRVGSLGAQRIIDDCFAGDTSLCQYVTRNAGGFIDRVTNPNLNITDSRTAGVDIEARYNFEPNFFANRSETLNLRVLAGRLLENSTTTTVYRDDLGSQSSPQWNATGTLGYTVDNYGMRLIARYYDSTKINILWTEGVEVDRNHIASQTVLNLAFDYRGQTQRGGNWVATFNVTNLFDRNPPIIPSENLRGGQQGFGGAYDIFGRRYQLSLNYSF